ncbi:MAG: BatD family protein [Halioglobus sp.]
MRNLALFFLVLWLAIPLQAASQIESLLSEGELTVDASLSQSERLVPGQRTQLILEIATSRWFTGGTRIRIPEVPGLVILQTEQFAANASESRGGQTWVIQRWSLDLYPQRAGNFTIPPISLSLEVNAGEQGNIQGDTLSDPVDFNVQLPSALEQAEFWVATPAFSVQQSLNKDTDNLKPGDAFERRIEFRADDVLAMMLPEVNTKEQAGLATYPAPPILNNSSNRGQATGSRVQTISYVAEEPGSYLISSEDFFWWDTRTEELRVVSIPAVEVLVIAAPGAATDESTSVLNRAQLLTMAIGIAAIILMLWLLNRYRPWELLPYAVQPLRAGWIKLQDLRKPGLAKRLNPGSSAGD